MTINKVESEGGGMMNTNMFQRLTNRIPQQFYRESTSSFKIRGILVEKNQDTIKLNIGGDKILHARLKSSIDGEVGDSVTIDKKNILQSKLLPEKSQNQEPLTPNVISENQEREEMARILEKHGLTATKENLQLFMEAKASLEKVIEGLDYGTAIKLMEKDVAIEEESIEKLAKMVEEIKEEKKSFSFLKFFGKKKNMTLEEAERTATQLYGSKMGKDFTDIIKALHKAGIEITKDHVERINNIFAKLDDLQNIQEDTIIDSLKNKIEASIDNLYKIKNAITKNVIGGEEKVSQYATKAYAAMTYTTETISDQELKAMEERIKEILLASDLEPTKENISMAKELVRNGVELSAENMNKLQEIKTAIKELRQLLDHRRAAELLREGVPIEKENVVKLVKLLKDGIGREEYNEGADKALMEEKVKKILETIQKLERIDERQLLQLIKKGVDFKLSNLQLVVGGKGTFPHQELDASERVIYQQHIKTLQTLQQLNTLDFNSLARHISSRSPNTLIGLLHSHQMKKEDTRPIVIIEKDGIKDHIVKNLEAMGMKESMMEMAATKPFHRNAIVLHRENLLRIYEINGHVENIKGKLSSHILKDLVEKGLAMEEMPLEELSEYVDEKIKTNFNKRVEGMGRILQNINRLGQEKETILSLLMKHTIPMELKKVNSLSLFLNNKQQIAIELDRIIKLLEKSHQEDLKELSEKMKTFLKEASDAVKAGGFDIEKVYQQLGKWMKEIESKGNLLTKVEREALEKSTGSLKDALDLQSQLNREDTVLQLPVMMDQQLKNLQIYIMDKKKRGRKIDPNDMSILLSFDTNNMGNINIYAAVNYKKVILRIGVKNQIDQRIFEEKKDHIEEMLKTLGYQLKEMSFRVEEDYHLFSMVEEEKGLLQSTRNMLDIKI